MEYDNNVRNFVPKLRLIGRDFIGVPFDEETWIDFKNVLEEVTMFFGSYDQKIMGRRISIGKLCINLTTSHCDRAVEIYESTDEVDDSRGQKKKFFRNIVFKLTTLTNLRKLVKCIDSKFVELNRITALLDVLLDEFVKKLYAVIQHPQDSQYFLMTAQVIETSDIRLNEDEILKMKNNLSGVSDLSCAEISNIFYEFLCIKPDYSAYKYNILYDASRKNSSMFWKHLFVYSIFNIFLYLNPNIGFCIFAIMFLFEFYLIYYFYQIMFVINNNDNN